MFKGIFIFSLCLWSINAALANTNIVISADIPKGLRDPTEPVNVSSNSNGSTEKSDVNQNDLQLIYYRPGHSFIILGGQKFTEGDVIGRGHRIQSIQKDRVILQNKEDKPIVILWSQLTIKSIPNSNKQKSSGNMDGNTH